MKIEIRRPVSFSKKLLFHAAFSLLAGCATGWKVESVYYQPVQTKLHVETEPASEVLVNHRRVGRTPVETLLDYEKEVRVERRRVSYWITEPGWSLFLTLSTLGVYLPFSAIPADTESRFVETGRFRNNAFLVQFEDGGRILGETTLEAKGEPELSVNTTINGSRGD